MRRVLAASLALAALQGCNAEPMDTGVVTGLVKLGPIMPVCQVGVPCDGVYKGAKIVLRTPSGQVAKRVTADDTGAFQMDTPAGSFEVSVDVEGPLPRCAPVPVFVKAQKTVRVEIDCDSGIR